VKLLRSAVGLFCLAWGCAAWGQMTYLKVVDLRAAGSPAKAWYWDSSYPVGANQIGSGTTTGGGTWVEGYEATGNGSYWLWIGNEVNEVAWCWKGNPGVLGIRLNELAAAPTRNTFYLNPDNCSWGSYITNYWATAVITNGSYLWEQFTVGVVTTDGWQPLATNAVMPGQSWTVTVTNSVPFTLRWIGDREDTGQVNGTAAGNQVNYYTNQVAQNLSAAVNDPSAWTAPAPQNVGTNTTTEERRSANADLLVSQAAQAQTHSDLQKLLAAIQALATNGSGGGTGSVAIDYRPYLWPIISNTLATAANLATQTGMEYTNWMGLRGELRDGLSTNFGGLEGALTNRAGLPGGLGADTNGLVTALETGNSGFNSAVAGKLGVIPTWSQAAPSYLLPFSQLGLEGLEDAHFDFGQTGFEHVVPLVRGFLLFLVTVAGVLAGYRIIRNFEPS